MLMKKMSFLIIVFATIFSVFSQKGKTYVVFFDTDSYALSLEELKTLNKIKEETNSTKVGLSLFGYTDSTGDSSYNLKLSNKRVNAVKEYFKNYKIEESIGYGELKGKGKDKRKVVITVKDISEIGLSNNFSKIKRGQKKVINDLIFLPGTDSFAKTSYKPLKELYQYLKKNYRKRIRILGHICCPKTENPATDEINKRTGKRNLSEARALRVYNYLARKGIKKNRLSYKGMAYKNPLGGEEKYNRRVEIQIVR